MLATVTTAELGELAPGEFARRIWNCDESAFATDHSLGIEGEERGVVVVTQNKLRKWERKFSED